MRPSLYENDSCGKLDLAKALEEVAGKIESASNLATLHHFSMQCPSMHQTCFQSGWVRFNFKDTSWSGKRLGCTDCQPEIADYATCEHCGSVLLYTGPQAADASIYACWNVLNGFLNVLMLDDDKSGCECLQLNSTVTGLTIFCILTGVWVRNRSFDDIKLQLFVSLCTDIEWVEWTWLHTRTTYYYTMAYISIEITILHPIIKYYIYHSILYNVICFVIFHYDILHYLILHYIE